MKRIVAYSKGMNNGWIKFGKKHAGLMALVMYGFFSIFYKWSGSFMGDEAIYSQVAKEGLADNSWLVLHWKGQLWFEKPPLIIWLTMVSFKIFGVAETTAHILPGIFGILSAVLLYFLGLEIFKNKWAGFFAGFVFLTTPVVFLYNRVNMLDIPVGMFGALAVLAMWKIIFGKKRWWLVLGFALGMGVLTKSIIGLFPVILIGVICWIYKKRLEIKNKLFPIGLGIFWLVAAPWHLFMTLKFGTEFWREYLGYHIWRRFGEQIFLQPWENNSAWGYGKLFFARSGIWIWLAVIFFAIIVADFVARWLVTRWGQTQSKNSALGVWFNLHRKDWLFLASWGLVVTLPFFFAVTKLPNYMLLAYFPLALFVGGWLGYLFSEKKYSLVAIVMGLALLNFFSSWQLRASDFGESHFLFPKFLIRYGHFGESELRGVAIILLFLLLFLWLRNMRRTLWWVALTLVLGMNILVPFPPLRNEFVKKFGADLSEYSAQQPLQLYFLMRPEQFHFNNVGTFYLPLGSVVENVGQRQIELVPSVMAANLSFCFIEKDFVANFRDAQALLAYPEGIIIRCAVSEIK